MSVSRNGNIEKTRSRSPLRRALGREFYILRRKLRWWLGRRYVRHPKPGKGTDSGCRHSLIVHKSMMLRPLKDVEMYLQHNKVTNLRLACARLDGIVIRPGERFSLWKLVGRPTARKGYLEGLAINNGQIGKSIGGGLCQLGNLLYWMLLHTDLKITERHRHSFDVFPDVNRSVPFACGATLGYNYIDLGFRNPSQSTYTIRLWQDDTHLWGEILCDTAPTHRFEVFETDHCIRQQWWGGYTRHNRIWKRRINLADGSEEVLPISENHAVMMYAPLLPQPTEQQVS